MGVGYNRNCVTMYCAAHGLVLQSHTFTAIVNTGFTSISTRHYMKNDDSFLTDIRPCTNTKQHFTRQTRSLPSTRSCYWLHSSPQFTATDNYIRKLFTKQHWCHTLRRRILWVNRPLVCYVRSPFYETRCD